MPACTNGRKTEYDDDDDWAHLTFNLNKLRIIVFIIAISNKWGKHFEH